MTIKQFEADMRTYAIIIFILIFFYTFYMGFNDGSNAIATTVATRAIKPKLAILIAAITKLVVPIAIFYISKIMDTQGLEVAGNISGKIIYQEYFLDVSAQKGFAFLLSGMMGAIVWGLFAYLLKIPNSTSHTLLGGIIGAGIAAFGIKSIQWTNYVLVNVILMVVLAPILVLVLSFFTMRLVKRLLRKANRRLNSLLVVVQRVNLIILSAAFSSNNVQKSLGIFLMLGTLGLSTYDSSIPIGIIIIFASALTLGMLLGGYRVINTVGRKIFKLQDVHSVVAQMTTSVVMIVATQLGISVSTGQIMSSSVMGVGASERISSVNWNTAIRIVISWALTLPIAATVGAVLYLIIGKLILNLP